MASILSFCKSKILTTGEKFKQLQGTPASLARGCSIGVFLGFAPITPFKTLLVFVLTFLCPSNTIACWLVCAIICNPLTYIPLYYIAWFLGNLMLPDRASWEQLKSVALMLQETGLRGSLHSLGSIGIDVVIVTLAGGCTLALILAAISYPLAFRAFVNIARKRSEKHVLNN